MVSLWSGGNCLKNKFAYRVRVHDVPNCESWKFYATGLNPTVSRVLEFEISPLFYGSFFCVMILFSLLFITGGTTETGTHSCVVGGCTD